MNQAVTHTMRPMSLPMPGHVPGPVHMSGPNLINQDVHTRQTIDRLQCIQKHLKNPQSFVRTARELLEWCSDTRAFQSQFHQCLMNCLTVINEVAGKREFDLDLCYRLVALCHDQRNKFPEDAAALIGVWFQRMQKLVMLHQHPHMDPMKHNNISSQSVHGSSPGNMMSPKMGYAQSHASQRPHDQSWNQSGQVGPAHPNQHPSLSVITTATVWGVSTTQTPPIPVHSQSSSTSFAQQHMGHSVGHNGPDNIQSNYNNNYAASHPKPSPGDSFNNSSMYSGGHRGVPQGRMPPQNHHTDQSHQQPAAAAAAAAAAVAAATATATATATFFKEQQDQNQINSYDQMQGGSMSHNMQDSSHMHQSMTPHQQHAPPGPNHHGMHPQGNRARPQMPPQYGRAASVPNSFQMGSGMRPMTSPRPLTHNGPPMYNNDPSYKQSCRPQPPYGQAPYNGSPNMPDVINHMGVHRHASVGTPTAPGYSPRLPGSGSTPLHSNVSQHQYYSQQNHPEHMNSYAGHPQSHRAPFPPHYPNETRFSNSQPPIPGNPTPPLTPGSAHNVPPYPAIANMTSVGMNDGKSGIAADPFFPPYQPSNGTTTSPSQPGGQDELRLTFPVRDGIVLGPFRLEHNLVVSSHAFHLRQNVYRTLFERPDLDLQFKCYHHDDVLKHTNWPHSVQVSVNSTPLTIPRGMDRSTHKPLYLKKVCQPGRNAIDITVSACCCSHFFVLQLVHRPSIRFVLKGLMFKRILPDFHCRTKIKRNFSSGSVAANNSLLTNGVTNGAIEQPGTTVKVSLRCPITYRRIQIPARGQECKHIQCFDLESYLQLNSDNATWRCPICHKNALLEVLEIDDFMQNILKTLQDRDCHLVSIDANCSWTPLPGTAQHEPLSRTSTGPVDHHDQLPNGMIKSEPFNHINVKQEPGHTGFSIKQEQYISALSIKQEPHQHIKHDPDGPPNKRLKSVTSPGVNLNNLPAPSPGSSMACNKLDNNPGFPHSYDFNRFGNISSSGSHPGSGFLRGVSMTAEMSDQIAANDMVPIEKRLNPAMSNHNSMINGESPKRRCIGTPKTPQGPSTPLRPPSSSALTPQSIGVMNNSCSTPSSVSSSYSMGNSILTPASSNPTTSSPNSSMNSNNPTTPIVSLSNCDTLDTASVLDSLFNDDVTCGEPATSTSLNFDTSSGIKTDSGTDDAISALQILPDSELMDMFPLPDLGPSNSNNNTAEDQILSLFDNAP